MRSADVTRYSQSTIEDAVLTAYLVPPQLSSLPPTTHKKALHKSSPILAIIMGFFVEAKN